MHTLLIRVIYFVGGLALGLGLASRAQAREIILTPENTIQLLGIVNKKNIDVIISKVKEKSHNSSELYLLIDSPGGYLDDADRLIGYLNNQGRLIHTISIYAFSAAFIIVQQNKGLRLMLPDAQIGNHEIAIRLTAGYIATINNTLEMYKQLKEENDIYTTIILKRVKMDKNRYVKMLKNEFLFSAQKSLKHNFIDQIVDIKCSKKLLESTVSYFKDDGETITVPACPLII